VIFPNHPAKAVTLAVYLEALGDLTPEQLEIGCREATSAAEQFPKPGHIRKAHEQNAENAGEVFLGPRLLEYDAKPLSEEEKKQAAEDSERLRKLLDPAAQMPKPKPVQAELRSLHNQLCELKERGWLK
jgi:hypothetical protein